MLVIDSPDVLVERRATPNRHSLSLLPEIYVERLLDTGGRGRMRVMVLENLREDIALQRLNRHLG